MSFELPGNSQAWSVVLGPVALACLASLLSLLGAVVRWRQERSLRWIVLLAPLVVATPILTAYSQLAGLLVMGLLLQPFALWVWWPVFWRLVGRPAPGPDSPRWAIARWAFVAGCLPAVWFGSCTFGFIGEVNHRIAKLESLPVPQGAQVVEKSVALFRLFRYDSILYRVPMPPEEAEAAVYGRFQAEGWVRRSEHLFARDGDCVYVFTQVWLWSPEWTSSENTQLELSLMDRDACQPRHASPQPPGPSPTRPPSEGPENVEPFGIPPR